MSTVPIPLQLGQYPRWELKLKNLGSEKSGKLNPHLLQALLVEYKVSLSEPILKTMIWELPN